MQPTIRQALAAAAARLAAGAEVSAPGGARNCPDRVRAAKMDAELLLMHVLSCGLPGLLAHPERLLSEAESIQYEAEIARRLSAEPIQYITGRQEFFGLEMKVSPDVLIPRPETEHLVEAFLAKLAREVPLRTRDREVPLRILDIGTGSGAIAIALARALPFSAITAADLSSAALEVARFNAERHGVSERVRLLRSDLLEELQGETFDAVVSNPPYIAYGEELEPQVRDFEPQTALYAGPTGFEIFERLAPQAWAALEPGGLLALEIGYGQQSRIAWLLRDWRDLNFIEDLQGIPRVAIASR